MGAYGWAQEKFFASLEAADIDVLVDIRLRRGMRGSTYSFLNARALQSELAARGIGYVHLKELAPPKEVREVQKASDTRDGRTKRARESLSQQFIELYQNQVLGGCSPHEVIGVLARYRRPCFFCVEGPADACHRSLVAEWLRDYSGCPIKHI